MKYAPATAWQHGGAPVVPRCVRTATRSITPASDALRISMLPPMNPMQCNWRSGSKPRTPPIMSDTCPHHYTKEVEGETWHEPTTGRKHTVFHLKCTNPSCKRILKTWQTGSDLPVTFMPPMHPRMRP